MVAGSFKCGANATLCLREGATCVFDSAQNEVCLCPPGYEWDFTIAHFPNCALPTWFLPAFFGLTTAAAVVAIGFFLLPDILRLKTNHKLQRIAIAYASCMLFIWLHVLCVLVQRGTFEAGLFFLIWYPISLYFAAYMTLAAIVKPLHASIGASFDSFARALRIYFYVLALLTTGLLVSMFAFARADQDRDIFNVLFGVFLIIAVGAFALTTFLVNMKARQLEKTIQRVKGNVNIPIDNKMLSFLDQLKALRNVVRVISLGGLVLIIQPALMFSWGSCPYQFIIWAANMSIFWPTAHVASKFLRAREVDDDVGKRQGTQRGTPSGNTKLLAISS